MGGRLRSSGRTVGALAVLLCTAHWNGVQPATPEPSGKNEATASDKPAPRTSDYLRAAHAARARLEAAPRQLPVVFNEDLPGLQHVERPRGSAEPAPPPGPGNRAADAGTARRADRSDEHPPAVLAGEVTSPDRPASPPATDDQLREQRARISRWEQRMAQAESELRAIERQIEQLEREKRAGAAVGQAPAGRRAQLQARRREIHSRVRSLLRQKPDG